MALLARSSRSSRAARGIVALGRVDEPHAHGPGQPGEERRAGDQDAVEAVPGAERRRRAGASPPLEGDRVERGPPVASPARVDRVRREAVQDLAAPPLGRARRRGRLGHDRQGAEHRVAVAEEGLGVGDARRGRPRRSPARPRPAPPRGRAARGSSPSSVARRHALQQGAGRPGRRRRPPARWPTAPRRAARCCAARRGRAPRRPTGVEAVAARLEHGASGELRRRVAEDRPVGHLARRRPSRAERPQQAGAAARRERRRGWGSRRPRWRCAPRARGGRGRRGRQAAGRGASA